MIKANLAKNESDFKKDLVLLKALSCGGAFSAIYILSQKIRFRILSSFFQLWLLPSLNQMY